MESISLNEVVLDIKTSTIEISGLKIEDQELYNYLLDLEEDKRIDIIKRAIKIGAVVLQVMDTTSRVDYVRSEFDKMQTEFNNEMDELFSEKGTLLLTLDKFLGEKGELKQTLEEHFGEQGSVIYKILNPDDETTPLGKFKKQLRQELDTENEGTAFNKLKTSMDDGFEKVLVAVGAMEAKEEEREKGTAKGFDFEEQLFESLDMMAKDFGDIVEHVGTVKGPLGNVGDLLIHINSRDTKGAERSIVLEAKKKKVSLSGKSSFLIELDNALENRGADYVIGAIHESHAPESCGCFRFFDKGKIICSVSDESLPLPLEIAYKVARYEIIAAIRKESGEFDITQLEGYVNDIETQLEMMRSIKRALTGASKNIKSAETDLKTMEDSIKQTLDEIWELLGTDEE